MNVCPTASAVQNVPCNYYTPTNSNKNKKIKFSDEETAVFINKVPTKVFYRGVILLWLETEFVKQYCDTSSHI